MIIAYSPLNLFFFFASFLLTILYPVLFSLSCKPRFTALILDRRAFALIEKTTWKTHLNTTLKRRLALYASLHSLPYLSSRICPNNLNPYSITWKQPIFITVSNPACAKVSPLSQSVSFPVGFDSCNICLAVFNAMLLSFNTMKTLSSLSRQCRRQCFQTILTGILWLVGLAGFFASLDMWCAILWK